MTTPFWCLVVVAVIPVVLAGIGDVYRKRELGSLDNDDPRRQATRLEGAGARAYAAQENAWEALPTFAVAVFIAHLAGAPAQPSATAALLFVAARVLHAIFYIRGLSTLRSASFLAALACCGALIVMAARA